MEPDPGGRRRLVALAGHTGDAATARDALTDADPRVRATAIGALERLGRLDPDDLTSALGDRSVVVRRRACEGTYAAESGSATQSPPEPSSVRSTAL